MTAAVTNGGSGVRNAPMAGIFHGSDILIQCPLARLEWRSGPVLPAAFELVFCYAQVDGIFGRVHRDCISIVNKCNKAAYLCFRDNVANYEPMGALQKQGRRNAQSGKLEFQGRVGDAHPPLNLPSVTQATSWPSPAPIIKLVGFSISGMPDFYSFFLSISIPSDSQMTYQGRPSDQDTAER